MRGSPPEATTQRPRARPGRAYRLRGVAAFAGLFRAGERHAGAWIELIAGPAQAIPGRVGFVVGRKALPRAVDRNRVRRVLRDAAAAARPAIEAYDVILRLKRQCTREEVRAVGTEARALLANLVGRTQGGALR